MSFLKAARPAGREWSVEEAAVYAARRDYELLKLLSKDRSALRTARILGLQLGGLQQQTQPTHAAANDVAAATKEQPGEGSTAAARQRRKRRPSNAARRQKQRERSQQKRLKHKLLKVLPVVHKWAVQQQQRQADEQRMHVSPPASPPCSDCGSGVGPPDGSAARSTQQRSYAAAVAVEQQAPVAAVQQATAEAAAMQQPMQHTMAARHQQHGLKRSDAAAAQRYELTPAAKCARMRMLAQACRDSNAARSSTPTKAPVGVDGA